VGGLLEIERKPGKNVPSSQILFIPGYDGKGKDKRLKKKKRKVRCLPRIEKKATSEKEVGKKKKKKKGRGLPSCSAGEKGDRL